MIKWSKVEEISKEIYSLLLFLLTFLNFIFRIEINLMQYYEHTDFVRR